MVRLVYVLTPLDPSGGDTSGFSHEGCKRWRKTFEKKSPLAIVSRQPPNQHSGLDTGGLAFDFRFYASVLRSTAFRFTYLSTF